MKKLLLILVMLSTMTLNSCLDVGKPSAEQEMTTKTNQAMAEANAQVGMPAIKNFQERKLAKMIFELRDKEDLICYAYLLNRNSGALIFIGKCLGYGLPYSVQYTNPMKPHYRVRSGSITGIALPQADPNGLYMPTGLSATWLIMIDKNGKGRPVYIEPEIIVSPFKLTQ